MEEFAYKKNIKIGFVTIIGGVSEGNIVTGLRHSEELPPSLIITSVDGVHEMIGTGVISQDEKGQPKLHLHGVLGRDDNFIAGCFRPGLKTWLVDCQLLKCG